MKLRLGFVSNSSSSSFIVDTYYITQEQKDVLLNPLGNIEKLKEIYKANLYDDELFDKGEFDCWCENHFGCFDQGSIDDWSVYESNDKIEFSCYMDNFQYEEYAEIIGIPRRAIK